MSGAPLSDGEHVITRPETQGEGSFAGGAIAAVPTHGFSRPFGSRPGSAWAALDIALAQRRVGGVVAGGVLDVAELGPGGIATRALFDLDRGEFAHGAPPREGWGARKFRPCRAGTGRG